MKIEIEIESCTLKPINPLIHDLLALGISLSSKYGMINITIGNNICEIDVDRDELIQAVNNFVHKD